jgi:hypothetical protein
MIGGSLRSRLALLYAGVFLALAVVVLAIPFLAVSETVHVGSSAPPVVRHPGRDLYPQVSTLMISLAVIAAVFARVGLAARGPLAAPASGHRRDRTGHLRHQPQPAAADRPPRRRVQPARPDAERPVRTARGVIRVATAFRGQRRARAAHPADRRTDRPASGARRPRGQRGHAARGLRRGAAGRRTAGEVAGPRSRPERRTGGPSCGSGTPGR